MNASLPLASDEDAPDSRATLKMSLAGAYMVMFIFGVVGNCLVIVMICNVLSAMRKMRGRRRASGSNTSHVFIYVLGLSIVDLLVLLHLPFLVFELMKGQWLFGEAMCKLYWFGESVNKLLSSFIMMVLSWDRYLAVCSPVDSIKMRSNSVAVMVILVCSLLAIVLLLPVLVQASVIKIDRIKMIPLVDGSDELRESDEKGSTLCKCMFESDAVFTLYTFVIGFLLPAIFITVFYSRVIYRLRRSPTNMCSGGGSGKKTTPASQNAANRVKQVTSRVIAVIAFYFFCWTPQWTLNIMSQFNLIHVSWMTPALSAMFFIAHLLVCFNSAANPVLYALINRELRSQHMMAMAKKRQSIVQTANCTKEAISRHKMSGARRISELSVEIGRASSLANRIRHSLSDIRQRIMSGDFSGNNNMMKPNDFGSSSTTSSMSPKIIRIPNQLSTSIPLLVNINDGEDASKDAFL